MKAPSKKLIIIMIAVILLFVIIAAVMPDREVTKEKANLIVSIDTNIPVGSVQVNFTRWDGSLSSEAVMNADGSMMGGYYSPHIAYYPEQLGGLSVTRFAEAVTAEFNGAFKCRAGGNFCLHTHRYFKTFDPMHPGVPKQDDGKETYIFEIRKVDENEYGFMCSYGLKDNMVNYQALIQIRELIEIGYYICFA